MLDRGEYWQCAFVIPKGGFATSATAGFRPFATPRRAQSGARRRVNEIASWDDVKLLTVRVDRLKRWYKPGVLCIGDAAHAMSPVGGVGINLAIQDAVAAANSLAAPLRQGTVPVELLAKVQKRREWPTRLMRAVQIAIQTRVIQTVLTLQNQPRPPLVARLLDRFPYLRRFPARLIGLGFRPEHVGPEIRNQRSDI